MGYLNLDTLNNAIAYRVLAGQAKVYPNTIGTNVFQINISTVNLIECEKFRQQASFSKV